MQKTISHNEFRNIFKKSNDLTTVSKKLADIGINQGDFFNAFVQPNFLNDSFMNPAIISMYSKRFDLLWHFIDKNHLDASKILLTYDDDAMPLSLLSYAAEFDCIDFIKEWHARGLSLSVDEPGSPLIFAIITGRVKSIELLNSLGADWNVVKEIQKTFFSNESNKSVCKKIKFNTSPIALGLSSRNPKIISITKENNAITEQNWKTLIPNPTYPLHITEPYFIKLEEMVPNLLQIQVQNECLDRHISIGLYSSAWWEAWQKNGVMDDFKKTTIGKSIDFDSIIREDNPNLQMGIFNALADPFTKKTVTKESLSYCIKLLLNPKPSEEHIKTSLTSPRMKEIWKPDGILEDIPVTSMAPLNNSYQANAPFSPLFGVTVLRHLENPSLWKYGTKYEVFCNQFWDVLATSHDYIHKSISPNHNGQMENPSSYLSKIFIPGNFYAFKQNNPEKLFSILNMLASNANTETIKKSLLTLATSNNEIYGNPKTMTSEACINWPSFLSIGNILEWGIINNHLDPRVVYESIKRIPTVHESLAEHAAHFTSKIERHVLNTKLSTSTQTQHKAL